MTTSETLAEATDNTRDLLYFYLSLYILFVSHHIRCRFNDSLICITEINWFFDQNILTRVNRINWLYDILKFVIIDFGKGSETQVPYLDFLLGCSLYNLSFRVGRYVVDVAHV